MLKPFSLFNNSDGMNNKTLGILVCSILIIIFIIILFLNTGSTKIFKTDNDVILNQELNSNNQGYTVMCLWGTYYEMGYAHAELLGDYIVRGVNEIKSLLSFDYNYIRSSIADSKWIPSEIEDELDGMVDALAISHPTANIDKN